MLLPSHTFFCQCWCGELRSYLPLWRIVMGSHSVETSSGPGGLSVKIRGCVLCLVVPPQTFRETQCCRCWGKPFAGSLMQGFFKLWFVFPLESQKYCTVHCTGYMRSWPTSQLGGEGEGEADKQDSSHFSCLVAVGRVHSHSSPQVNGEIQVKPTEFITRYAMDGKFTFVDQR